jgi:hypothetical protein
MRAFSLREGGAVSRQQLMDPANDTGPQITTIPIAAIDGPVQLIRGDNGGSLPVLRDQRPSLTIDLSVAFFHCQCPEWIAARRQ